MNIFTSLQTKRKESLTNHEKVMYNIYGLVIGEVQRIQPNGDVDDVTSIKVIKKLIEGNNSTLAIITDENKIAVIEFENLVLNALLPQQLTKDELFLIMEAAIISDPLLKEKKAMFPYLKKNYAGLYSGQDASQNFDKLIG